MKALVFRFSAMGDVALTTPVIRGMLIDNPELEITFVSNQAFAPMFHGIQRLHFYGVDLSQYKGLNGLYRLYKEVASIETWDRVIDLHSVMRTWVLGTFFRLNGHKVFSIDKGRADKAELLSDNNKKLKQLTHSVERYQLVFQKAGIKGNLYDGRSILPAEEASINLDKFLSTNGMFKQHKWIGIAPFSKHREKEWPIEKVKKLITELTKNEDVRVLLLGGGPSEVKQLKQIASTHSHTHNFAGVLNLDEEISLIHKLDCVVAMDSFNMHLAALCGTPVVSVWGATHPFAGFGPLNDNEQYIVQIPVAQLECRPCSVFGSKKCHRGDWACMERIEVDQVIGKIEQAIQAA